MFKRLSLSFLFFIILASAVYVFSVPVFAENPFTCNGAIDGFISENNPNVGAKLSFDSHTGAASYHAAQLGIAGGTTGNAPDNAGYAACLAPAEVIGEYDLKGYAWADNIGFISFYCGADGKNEGVSCGDFPYGVKAVPDGDGFVLQGYAWSSTFGYINFYCRDHKDGVTSNDCGDVNYQVGLEKVEGTEDQYVVMNSKTVENNVFGFSGAGIFLNFDGMKTTLPKLMEEGDTWCETVASLKAGAWPVCVEVDVEGDTKVANGVEGYDVYVYFRDQNGIPLDMNSVSTLKLTFVWGDKVTLNQTDGLSTPDAIAWKPGVLSKSDFTDLVDSAYGKYKLTNKIRSYAPTNGGNLSKIESVKVPEGRESFAKFKNESFIPGFEPNAAGGHKVETNSLSLNSINYQLSLATGGPSSGSGYNGSVFANKASGALAVDFKPVVELEGLYTGNSGDKQDVIVAYRDIPVVFTLSKKTNDSSFSWSDVTVGMYLFEGTDTQTCEPLAFNFIEGFSGKTFSKKGSELPSTFLAEAYIEGEEQEDIDYCTYTQSPALYSVIEYGVGGKNVKYYGNKLPRLDAGNVANLSVTVHGNVYAQFADVTSQDVDPVLTSGSAILNVVKDTVKRNLAKYLKGVTDDKMIALDNGEVIDYHKGDFNIGGGEFYSGKKVVVVEDGDLYIKGNLKPANDQARLVLVVLNGNVYVDIGVTDIYASLVADGSIFSWYEGFVKGDYGEPDDPQEFFAKLKDESAQLYWEGSIAADNTIGGADKIGREKFYYRGGIPTSDKDLAQVYDLNYLRLFRLGVEFDAGGFPVDQECGAPGLTNEDIEAIAADPHNHTVTRGGVRCNGIDVTKCYLPKENGVCGPDGDLVPMNENLSPSLDKKRQGESANDALGYMGPVYIFYKPSDSFIFKSK